jgi:hypothetical protein
VFSLFLFFFEEKLLFLIALWWLSSAGGSSVVCALAGAFSWDWNVQGGSLHKVCIFQKATALLGRGEVLKQ